MPFMAIWLCQRVLLVKCVMLILFVILLGKSKGECMLLGSYSFDALPLSFTGSIELSGTGPDSSKKRELD